MASLATHERCWIISVVQELLGQLTTTRFTVTTVPQQDVLLQEVNQLLGTVGVILTYPYDPAPLNPMRPGFQLSLQALLDYTHLRLYVQWL